MVLKGLRFYEINPPEILPHPYTSSRDVFMGVG